MAIDERDERLEAGEPVGASPAVLPRRPLVLLLPPLLPDAALLRLDASGVANLPASDCRPLLAVCCWWCCCCWARAAMAAAAAAADWLLSESRTTGLEELREPLPDLLAVVVVVVAGVETPECAAAFMADA